jgi:hypothetical protein
MGYADGSLFGLDSYVQIRACGTYRRRSQPLAPFSDGNRVAPHVVWMLLTEGTLVSEGNLGDRQRANQEIVHAQDQGSSTFKI